MDDKLEPGAGGKVWRPKQEPAAASGFSFTSKPISRWEALVAWSEKNMVFIFIVLPTALFVGFFGLPTVYNNFVNPAVSATENGLFISPELSTPAAVSTVRDWVPSQEPFFITPDKIKDVTLNGITNGENGFIILKDDTVIPFTIHNAENVITVTPNTTLTLEGVPNE